MFKTNNSTKTKINITGVKKAREYLSIDCCFLLKLKINELLCWSCIPNYSDDKYIVNNPPKRFVEMFFYIF